MHATTQTEPPTRNYEEEIAAQIAITEKTKKHHEEDMAQLGKLREQVAKREAKLKRLLEERIAKLQATEKEVANIQAANTMAIERLAKEEETRE